MPSSAKIAAVRDAAIARVNEENATINGLLGTVGG